MSIQHTLFLQLQMRAAREPSLLQRTNVVGDLIVCRYHFMHFVVFGGYRDVLDGGNIVIQPVKKRFTNRISKKRYIQNEITLLFHFVKVKKAIMLAVLNLDKSYKTTYARCAKLCQKLSASTFRCLSNCPGLTMDSPLHHQTILAFFFFSFPFFRLSFSLSFCFVLYPPREKNTEA